MVAQASIFSSKGVLLSFLGPEILKKFFVVKNVPFPEI